VVIVYLAQRFQVLTNLSPLDAGIHIIPYSAVATVATMLACLASRKFHMPVVYFALLGSILHTVGMSLLSILPETRSYPSEGYGYEAIAGAGAGITIGILTLAVPYIVETRDLGNWSSFFSWNLSFDRANPEFDKQLRRPVPSTRPDFWVGLLDWLLRQISSTGGSKASCQVNYPLNRSTKCSKEPVIWGVYQRMCKRQQ